MAQWLALSILICTFLANFIGCSDELGSDCDALVVQDTCDETCQACQQQALRQFVWALNGTGWDRRRGWLHADSDPQAHPGDHCTWFGVVCCGDDNSLLDLPCPGYTQYVLTNETRCSISGGVAAILLRNNSLAGQLNSSFFTSSAIRLSLEVVALENNFLTGNALQDLTDMPYLRYFNIDSNNITGTLAPRLFDMERLQFMSMAGNMLTGSIPEFSFDNPLAYVDMSHNRLQSSLPETWLANPSLRYFSAGFNQLTGEIPGLNTAKAAILNDWPSGWATLEIRLQGNKLTGSIPENLGYLQIQVLDLAGNHLTGPIDRLLQGLPILKELRINNNMLSGSLPQTFASSHIETFSVKYNNLSGLLPDALGNLHDLTELMMQNNSFSGDFPESIGSLIGLEVLTAFSSGLSYDTLEPNDNGDFLPMWAYIDKTSNLQTASSLYNFLLCKPLRVNKKKLPNLASLQIDPLYYRFQECHCTDGYSFKVVNAGTPNQTRACISTISAFDAHKTLIVGSVTAASGAISITGFVLCLFWVLRYQIAAFTLQRAKKRGPPEQGKTVSFVNTDIEGSTELWEWNKEAMYAATKIHDKVMRSKLTEFHGYEVSTEGDCFVIAFHEPADAVAWAVTMQQDLLMANWPKQLQFHERTCVRWMANGSATFVSSATAELEPHAISGPYSLEGQGLTSLLTGASENLDARASLDHAFLAYNPALNFDSAFGHDGENMQSEIAYRGLAVRMAIATGKAEAVRFHRINRRNEYGGHVMKVMKAISNVPNGGQIIIDSSTFTAVNSIVADLTKLLGHGPDLVALSKIAKLAVAKAREAHSLTVLQPIESGTAATVTSLSPMRKLLKKYSWQNSSESNFSGKETPPNTRESVSIPELSSFNPNPPDRLSGLFRHAWDVCSINRMYVKKDSAKSSESSAQIMTSNRRDLRKIDSSGSDHRVLDLVTPSRERSWWGKLLRRGEQEKKEHVGGLLIFMDMGQHAVKELTEPKQLYQVLIPALEDRARLSPEIATFEQITTGYFDAPATRQARLGAPIPSALAPPGLPPVTLVFCQIEGLSALKEHPASTTAVALYLSCVRRLLKKTKGYECQEADSTFMLAFDSPVDAVQFCLLAQEELMNEVWGEEVLKIPACCVLYGEKRQMLFQGPRVKMGMYEGIPTRVCPHTTSGRADYFGPLVNRAARFCLSAAYGGQIVLPLEIVQKVITEWSQRPCPPMPENGKPVTSVRGTSDGLNLGVGGYQAARTPRPSLLHATREAALLPKDALLDICETENTKSLRVMEWVAEDSNHPLPTSLMERLQQTAAPLSLHTPTISVQGRESVLTVTKDSVNGLHTGEHGSDSGVETDTGSVPPKTADTAKTHAVHVAAEEPLHRRRKPPYHPSRHALAQVENRKPSFLPDGQWAPDRSKPHSLAKTLLADLELQHTSGSQDERRLDALSCPPSVAGISEGPMRTARRRKSVYSGRGGLYPDHVCRNSIISDNDSDFISMLQSDAWCTMQEVEARHIGDMKFKGVHGIHTMMQINDARYSGRSFPPAPPEAKAELVSPGKGLAYNIVLNQ